MTFSKILKDWWRLRYARAWRRLVQDPTRTKNSDANEFHLPWNDFNLRRDKGVETVLVIDGSMKLKYRNQSSNTGIKFVYNQMLQEAIYFLDNTDGVAVYFCIDIHPRLINKQHKGEFKCSPETTTEDNPDGEAYVGEPPKPTTEMMTPLYHIRNGIKIIVQDPAEIDEHREYYVDDDTSVIDNSTIPSPTQWEGFLENKILYGELIHYITSYIFNPESLGLDPVLNKADMVSVPHGKHLYLWGGSLSTPAPRSVRKEYSKERLARETFETSVFFLANVLNSDTNKFQQISGRCKPHVYDLHVLKNLKEADLAALYFIKENINRDVIVLSGDGDLLMLLLLQSRDRLDSNGQWLNNVTLRLVVRVHNKTGYSKPPVVEEIDINVLYTLVMQDSRINTSVGIPDPVLYLVAISCLVDNDFIIKFGYGIGNVNITTDGVKIPPRTRHDGSIQIPTAMYTFLADPGRYRNLLEVMIPDERLANFSVVPIRVNENEFIIFAKDCYYHRHVESTMNNLGISMESVTIANVRTYLMQVGTKNGKVPQEPRSRAGRMITQRSGRVFARQLWWVLNYWKNIYRGNGSYPPSPIVRYNGRSVYGWVQVGKMCYQASRVSEWIALDAELIKKNDGIAHSRTEDPFVSKYSKMIATECESS